MNLHPYDTWAKTVWGEARGEPFDGRVAVAWVVRNRADHPKWWGRTIEEVCLHPFQFSCWNDDDHNRDLIMGLPDEDPLYLSCLGICLLVARGELADPTGGAVCYHTKAKPPHTAVWPPRWAQAMVHTCDLGAHQFYRERA